MITPILTVTEYQNIMGRPVKVDDRAEFIIDLVTSQIIDKCNNTFSDGYPEALKLTAAKMVNIIMIRGQNDGLQSLSQGGLSYTFKDSAELLSELNQYKIGKLGFGMVVGQLPIDKRGRI